MVSKWKELESRLKGRPGAQSLGSDWGLEDWRLPPQNAAEEDKIAKKNTQVKVRDHGRHLP